MTHKLSHNIDIETLILSSFDGSQQMSIENHMIEISIIEDMFTPTITGHILMHDMIDLYTQFPIRGEEYIKLQYNVPGIDDPKVDLLLKVTAVSKPNILDDQKTKTYIVSFASKEILTNETTRISRTIKKTPTQIVQSIIKNDLRSNKQINISDDTDIIKAIIPRWSPLQTIDFFKRKATSTDTNNPSVFVFYETINNGYTFKSIKNIIEDGMNNFDPDKHRFFKQFIEDPLMDKVNPLTNIVRVSIDVEYNTLKKIKSGQLSNKTTNLNLLNKEIVENHFKYKNKWDSFYEDSVNPLNSYSSKFLDGVTGDAAIQMMMVADYDEEKNRDQSDISGARIAFMTELPDQSLTIELSGNPTLSVGDVIFIELYETTGVEKEVSEIDYRLSGFYCIQGIKTHITKQNMTTTVKAFFTGAKEPIDHVISGDI